MKLSDGQFKSRNDKKLGAILSQQGAGYVPVKVWSPDGVFFVATAVTPREISGSLVCDGMDVAEYWPLISRIQEAQITAYKERVMEQMKRTSSMDYAKLWVSRFMDGYGDTD